MAKQAAPEGYTDQDQKDDQLEALRIEHETYLRYDRKDRAEQVAAYAKKFHGETLGAARGRAAAQTRDGEE